MRVDPHYVTGLVAALNSTGAREQQLTAEVSSGVRLSAISDDPAAAEGHDDVEDVHGAPWGVVGQLQSRSVSSSRTSSSIDQT